MDPNKRGNPPYEPSSHAAGMQRTIARSNAWSEDACKHTRMMLDGDPAQRAAGEAWWRAHFDQPKAVLS